MKGIEGWVRSVRELLDAAKYTIAFYRDGCRVSFCDFG